MWYEIIPSAAIIIVAMYVPPLVLPHVHKYFLGTQYRRSLWNKSDRLTYLRDKRVGGSPYTIAGLESIKD